MGVCCVDWVIIGFGVFDIIFYGFIVVELVLGVFLEEVKFKIEVNVV